MMMKYEKKHKFFFFKLENSCFPCSNLDCKTKVVSNGKKITRNLSTQSSWVRKLYNNQQIKSSRQLNDYLQIVLGCTRYVRWKCFIWRQYSMMMKTMQAVWLKYSFLHVGGMLTKWIRLSLIECLLSYSNCRCGPPRMDTISCHDSTIPNKAVPLHLTVTFWKKNKGKNVFYTESSFDFQNTSCWSQKPFSTKAIYSIKVVWPFHKN